MNRRVAVPALLCLLLLMAPPPPAVAENSSVLVTTATVQTQAVHDTLSAFGVLDPDPDQVLSLSLPHAGLINRVWVRLGQRVNSGDRLLEVVTAPDARMQYLQAQSAVDYARRERQRQQRLFAEQLATKSQVDVAEKNLQDARATLDALRQRGLDVASEILRAPMDGIVTRLDVSQGQRVQADTTAMLIAAEQKLIARLGVEPEDLGGLSVGTGVTITSVFGPAVRVESRVREVHAMIDPATHLVEILVPIPAAQVDRLVLGSRVLGRIRLATRQALTVPQSAILGQSPDTHLYRLEGGRARRVAVRVGARSGDLIEVSGDLRHGDQVVTSGNYELTDGMSVRTRP